MCLELHQTILLPEPCFSCFIKSQPLLMFVWAISVQLQESDVGRLVNVGVICYLKQLLDTGFFHAGE